MHMDTRAGESGQANPVAFSAGDVIEPSFPTYAQERRISHGRDAFSGRQFDCDSVSRHLEDSPARSLDASCRVAPRFPAACAVV